jgi:hypothetical protein
LENTSIKARYSNLATHRDPFLSRARDCALLTIPSLIPPDGSTGATKLKTPYQSLGARGVNTLASKLLLTLLPPNSPFFRLTIDDFTLQELTQQEGMRAEVEEALNQVERAVMNEIESSALRTPAYAALRHLLVGGNVLTYLMPQGGMKVFPLSNYVTKRDTSGNVLEIITLEKVAPAALSPELKAFALSNKDSKDVNKDVEIYTRIIRKDKNWEVEQEVGGAVWPKSKGTYPLDKSPWIPLRFIAIDGEDYGRGFVEEYMGDMLSLEGLTKAIVQASAAASKVVFLLRPNGTTSAKTLAEAESGDIKQGSAEDVTVLQMDKYADFRVALETRTQLQESLSFAFMLNTAIQRNGERVTAEEIRYMAQELEATLGGIYSTLSVEFQMPMVTRLMHQMERKNKLPALPQGIVRPTIVTGVEAIGRGNDLNKLSQFMQGLAQIPEAMGAINVSDFVKRWGTSLGIDMKGLVKSEEEMAQAQQQAQMMQMAEKLGPNAVNQLGGMAQKQMDQAPPQ